MRYSGERTGARHAREAVAFDLGVRALANLGVDLVVEVGPHAVLGPMLSLAWPGPDEGADAVSVNVEAPLVLASLHRPSQDEKESSDELDTSFMGAVARAYEAGLDLSFEGLFAGEARRRISLPGYPFQRERYWVEAPKRRRQSAGHPLLGERRESAGGEVTFETEVLPSYPAWMNDHRVFGRVIAPGALYGAMAISASVAEGSGSMSHRGGAAAQRGSSSVRKTQRAKVDMCRFCSRLRGRSHRASSVYSARERPRKTGRCTRSAARPRVRTFHKPRRGWTWKT